MNRILSRRDEPSSSAANAEGIPAVKTVRPDQPEPIPMRAATHRMGRIIVRFVALLAVVTSLLLLAWLR